MMNGRITKTAISLLLMMRHTHVIYQYEIDSHPSDVKGKVNLKPIFPLLFFHPRFLTKISHIYDMDPFNTLQACS